ncbi:hypothetical protein Adi01nite_55240 [Amorphoplanes digitatis]|nr:hypothetical protein GCM10020092_097880 [Actinoplanes digitatis]GID96112.1 hypothetical protein Adi01nite_55240 [Actinoplanes digitatis]
MQRARRLASTAVAAALVVGGLSACQAEPDVAAYVGSLGTIMADEVARVYDQAEQDLTASRDEVRQQQAGASAEPVPPVQVPFQQQDVLSNMLTVDILEQLALAHKVQPAAEPTVEQVAKATNYSPTWAYTELYARAYRLRSALLPAVAPAELTDAELRAVYDTLNAAAPGQVAPFEQFKAELSAENKKALEQSLGLRNEVEKVVAAEDVTSNPRFGTQELVLLSAPTGGETPVPLVTASLDAGTDASEAPFVAPAS